VFIGGEATEVEVISETEISAKTAASSPGTMEVVVEDEKGVSAGGPKFTYVTPPRSKSRTVVWFDGWWDCGCDQGDWVCERRDRENRVGCDWC
jgi:hypothetical protein